MANNTDKVNALFNPLANYKKDTRQSKVETLSNVPSDNVDSLPTPNQVNDRNPNKTNSKKTISLNIRSNVISPAVETPSVSESAVNTLLPNNEFTRVKNRIAPKVNLLLPVNQVPYPEGVSPNVYTQDSGGVISSTNQQVSNSLVKELNDSSKNLYRTQTVKQQLMTGDRNLDSLRASSDVRSIAAAQEASRFSLDSSNVANRWREGDYTSAVGLASINFVQGFGKGIADTPKAFSFRDDEGNFRWSIGQSLYEFGSEVYKSADYLVVGKRNAPDLIRYARDDPSSFAGNLLGGVAGGKILEVGAIKGVDKFRTVNAKFIPAHEIYDEASLRQGTLPKANSLAESLKSFNKVVYSAEDVRLALRNKPVFKSDLSQNAGLISNVNNALVVKENPFYSVENNPIRVVHNSPKPITVDSRGLLSDSLVIETQKGTKGATGLEDTPIVYTAPYGSASAPFLRLGSYDLSIGFSLNPLKNVLRNPSSTVFAVDDVRVIPKKYLDVAGFGGVKSFYEGVGKTNSAYITKRSMIGLKEQNAQYFTDAADVTARWKMHIIEDGVPKVVPKGYIIKQGSKILEQGTKELEAGITGDALVEYKAFLDRVRSNNAYTRVDTSMKFLGLSFPYSKVVSIKNARLVNDVPSSVSSVSESTALALPSARVRNGRVVDAQKLASSGSSSDVLGVYDITPTNFVGVSSIVSPDRVSSTASVPSLSSFSSTAYVPSLSSFSSTASVPSFPFINSSSGRSRFGVSSAVSSIINTPDFTTYDGWVNPPDTPAFYNKVPENFKKRSDDDTFNVFIPKKSVKTVSKDKVGYVPSIEAALFNIKSSKTNYNLAASGLTVRPFSVSGARRLGW